jgi:hypothetical protein
MAISARLLHALEHDSAESPKTGKKPPVNTAITAKTKASAEIPINTLIIIFIVVSFLFLWLAKKFCRLLDMTYNILQLNMTPMGLCIDAQKAKLHLSV